MYHTIAYANSEYIRSSKMGSTPIETDMWANNAGCVVYILFIKQHHEPQWCSWLIYGFIQIIFIDISLQDQIYKLTQPYPNTIKYDH